MSHDPSDALEPDDWADGDRVNGDRVDGDRIVGWPARIEGVVETVVATKGPNDRWNQAALGISAPGNGSDPIESGKPAPTIEPGATGPATARTFGRTRTRRNFEAGRDAFVQFTRDPVDFVDAALSTYETDAPILSSTDAWTEVDPEAHGRSVDRGTEVVDWTLAPIKSGVRSRSDGSQRSVPTTNRGRAAAIEATVPASRLDVDAYDERDLLQRLEWLGEVVDAAGDARSRAAFRRIDEHVAWRDRIE